MKAAKADKKIIEAEVKALLSLKNKYKSVTGQEYKANLTPTTENIPALKVKSRNNKPSSLFWVSDSLNCLMKVRVLFQESVEPKDSARTLYEKLVVQERKIKGLKLADADITTMEPELKEFMLLKLRFKYLTGRDYNFNSPPMVETPIEVNI